MTSPSRSTAALLALFFLAQGQLDAAPAQIARATMVAEIPGAAVFVVPSPSDPSSLVIGDQAGLLHRVRFGQINGTFLDLTSKVVVSALGGMQALAFHPNYQSNGFVYVYYVNSSSSSQLARYTVPNPGSLLADPSTEVVLLDLVGGISFHYGGGLNFGPDGKLYLAVGDQRVEFAADGCTSQNLGNLQGKLLRLNDDGSIPSDNPYVGVPGAREEIFARGLRQPFRTSFDPVTGGFFIGDVGESAREEVNYIPPGALAGANFEWRTLEGSLLTGSLLCPGPAGLIGPRIAPIFEYDHFTGCSVTGGLVVRGSGLPALEGQYLFADWCGGKTWLLDVDLLAATLNASQEVQAALDPPGPREISAPTSFAQASNGTVYLTDMYSTAPNTSEIYRLRADSALVTDRDYLSVAAGGTQHFELDAGATFGGRLYLLLGSVSGSIPGLTVDGLNLPLNFDAYTQFTLGGATGLLQGSIGLLDSNGVAQASLTLAPNFAPQIVGAAFHHAFTVIDLSGVPKVVFVSNAEYCRMIP